MASEPGVCTVGAVLPHRPPPQRRALLHAATAVVLQHPGRADEDVRPYERGNPFYLRYIPRLGDSGDPGGFVPQPAAEAVLQLCEVSRRFGGLRAVDQLSVSVRPGEVLGIIGPNGAGKSTLVGLIAGALRPTGGRVFFQGRDVTRMSPSRRARLGIARTFQITQPFAGLDIRENVLVGALYGQAGLRRSAALRVVDEVLERVGLAHKANLKGNQLTTADRKRLELARALATSPTLLLLDEVMAGLTPAEVMQAVALIREINKSGVTIVVIEHIMRAITGVSDRILVMHHGRKIAEDAPEAVMSDPRVVEAYLGSRYVQQRSRNESLES